MGWRVNTYILIITELINHCTMYSGRNYTILNVLWQSKGHVNAKYGHAKNDVICHRPSGMMAKMSKTEISAKIQKRKNPKSLYYQNNTRCFPAHGQGKVFLLNQT